MSNPAPRRNNNSQRRNNNNSQPIVYITYPNQRGQTGNRRGQRNWNGPRNNYQQRPVPNNNRTQTNNQALRSNSFFSGYLNLGPSARFSPAALSTDCYTFFRNYLYITALIFKLYQADKNFVKRYLITHEFKGLANLPVDARNNLFSFFESNETANVEREEELD